MLVLFVVGKCTPLPVSPTPYSAFPVATNGCFKVCCLACSMELKISVIFFITLSVFNFHAPPALNILWIPIAVSNAFFTSEHMDIGLVG